MKVIAINGSPHQKGNTWFALKNVGEVLENEGIDFEIIHIGNQSIYGCIACGECIKNQDNKCAIRDDELNDYLSLIKEADGIILGSPVFYKGIAGTMKCFLDRLFFVAGANGNWMRHKFGASVVAACRSEGSLALDGLNYYLTASRMKKVPSDYLNVMEETKEGESEQDLDGVQIMRILGANMAWLMKNQ